MIYTFLLCIHVVSASITENAVVESVLEQLPTVRSSQQDVKAAEAENLSALGAFDLRLNSAWTDMSGDYNYTYLDSKIQKRTSLFGLDLYAGFRQSRGGVPGYYGELETLTDGEWNFGARLPLLRGFIIDTNRANLRTSELQIGRRRFDLRATELREVETALYLYWNWKLAMEKVRISKGLLDTATQRDEWLTRRTRSGDLAAFEQKDNLRTLLIRRSSLLLAEQELKVAEARFVVYLSDEKTISQVNVATTATTLLPFDSEIPATIPQLQKPVAELVSEALKERPEFSSIALQLSQLDIERRLKRNQFLPQLDIKFEHSKDRGLGPTSLDDDNQRLQLQLELPLQYRRQRGDLAQVHVDVEKLKLERNFLERQWKADITAIQKILATAISRRELSRQELDLALQLEKGERKRLRQGETNVLIVNLREQASAEASLRWIETTIDVLKAYASLSLKIGRIPFME